jgi:hypothetical protein
MKKTVFNSAILAAIAALTFTPLASAHHMASDNMPDDQYDFVDDQISDMHNEIIDAMNEDDDLMMNVARSTDAVPSNMAMGDGANAIDTETQSMTRSDAQTVVAPGRGMGTAAQTSGSRR